MVGALLPPGAWPDGYEGTGTSKKDDEVTMLVTPKQGANMVSELLEQLMITMGDEGVVVAATILVYTCQSSRVG